jgi:hypothetical protein
MGVGMHSSSRLTAQFFSLFVILFLGLGSSVGAAEDKATKPSQPMAPAAAGEVQASSCHRVRGSHFCELRTPMGDITIAIPRSELKALLKQQ